MPVERRDAEALFTRCKTARMAHHPNTTIFRYTIESRDDLPELEALTIKVIEETKQGKAKSMENRKMHCSQRKKVKQLIKIRTKTTRNNLKRRNSVSNVIDATRRGTKRQTAVHPRRFQNRRQCPQSLTIVNIT